MGNKQKNLPTFNLKNISLIIMLAIVVIPNFFEIEIKLINDFLGIKAINWFYSLIVTISLAFLLRYIVYLIGIYKMNNKVEKVKFFDILKKNGSFIGWGFLKLFIISDYIFASSFKQIIKESNYERCPIRSRGGKHDYKDQEIECIKNVEHEYGCEIHNKKVFRKVFIILCNWQNLILSCLLVIITQISIEPGITGNSNLKEIFFAFLLLHTLSRVLEICIAFYKDVVVPRMSPELTFGHPLSNLKRGNRISLAVHSYIELALLFSLIYYINQGGTEDITSLFNMILYSFSIMAFNFSFNEVFDTFKKVVHLIQVFSSITLVVISIANYLGLKDEMNIYEKQDWKKGDYI